MAGRTDTNGTKAPGADVVEALAGPMTAGFMNTSIVEACEAWREKLEQAGPISPRDQFALTALGSHGKQLVTAVTPVSGGAP